MAETTGGARSATALRTSTRSTLRIFGVGVLATLGAFLVLASSSAETPGVTTRESVALDGGDADGSSANSAISADGQWVAFDSDADNLTDDDASDFRRVFVRDRMSPETTTVLVSLGPDGEPIPGHASDPSISGDGRYVAFVGELPVEPPPISLLGEDRPPDDCLRMQSSQVTEPATCTEIEYLQELTRRHVYVHDRDTGQTVAVDVVPGGGDADGDSFQPSISADGRRVAFTSDATNLTDDELLTEGTNVTNVFVRDLDTGTTTLVSVPADECPDDICFGGSFQPSLSPDGGSVAFTTDAVHLDLVNAPTPGWPAPLTCFPASAPCEPFTQVVVRDLEAGTTTLESRGPDGQAGEGDSFEPSISSGGSRVAFTSRTSAFDPEESGLVDDVFVRDRVESQTVRVSVDAHDGSSPGGDEDSGEPAISADGRSVAFYSGATNLVPEDEWCRFCRHGVYVHDTVRGTTALVSVNSDGQPPDGDLTDSRRPSVSADARYVAFDSDADDLVADDGNDARDVFVRDRIPVLVLAPDPLEFSPQAVGSGNVAALTASNAGSGPLRIIGAAVTDGDTGDFAVDPSACVAAALHREDSCSLRVRFRPTVEGVRTAVLEIESTDPRGPQRVRLLGAGALARAEVSPDPVAFGEQRVGTDSEARVVTLSSIGSATVEVAGVDVGGAHPGDFVVSDGCADASLAPGGSCEVHVVFRPTRPGPRTATLVFTDNAEGSPRSVTLTGTGVELHPGADVSPDIIDFGTQPLRTTSRLFEVTVRSTGEESLRVTDVRLTGRNPAHFLVGDGCTDAQLPPGESCTILLRFRPTALGTRSASLRIAHDAEDTPATVRLTGRGISPDGPVALLEAEPDPLDFPVRVIGTTSGTRQVTVLSAGDAPLTIADVTLAGAHPDDFALDDACGGQTLPPGQTCTIGVRFTPGAVGSRAGTLVLTHDGAGSPAEIVTGAEELVANGSFERPVVETDIGWDLFASDAPGLAWAVEHTDEAAPPPAAVELQRPGVGDIPGTWAPVDGRQLAELDGSAAVRIHQDLETAGFDRCTLRYAWSPRPGHADNAVEVRWGDAVVGDHSADGSARSATDWTVESLGLEPDPGSTTTLAFGEVGAADSFGTLLDAVSVVCATVETTEASTRTVSLTGAGVPADDPDDTDDRPTPAAVGLLTAAPDPADFGVVPAGQESEAQTVTVTSVGTKPVQMGAVAIGGQDAEQFTVVPDGDGCSGQSLAPGDTCEIVLSYAPDVSGRHSATLALPNDSQDALRALALRGLAPRLEADPPLGRPGFVTEVIGTDFPPNTPVRLRWNPGLGSQRVVTDDAGELRAWMLVLRRDHRGPRVLEARGEGFTVGADFLVVPPRQQPGDFVNRR